MNVLEGLDLQHRYRRSAEPVLRGVDLRIGAGERVALVGRSGSGKSTLVRALVALEPLSGGTILCEGRPVRSGPVRRLRWFRQIVQYVPQDPAGTLDPRARVLDLVAEPVRRLRGGDGLTESTAALDTVELPAELRQARVRDLSGGQAQRVAIARALSAGPRLLVADEPVSGLDAPLRAQVVDALRLASERRGIALLLVSHDMSAVTALCDRIALLHEGRLVENHPDHPEIRALLDAVPRPPF